MASKLILISDSGTLFCVDTTAGTITQLPSDTEFVQQQQQKAGDGPVATLDGSAKKGCDGAVAAIIMAKLG